MQDIAAKTPQELQTEIVRLQARVRELEAARQRPISPLAQSADAAPTLYQMIQAAPMICFALDQHGIITLCEGQGLLAVDMKPGQVVGHSAFERFGHYPEALHFLRRALAGESLIVPMAISGRILETRLAPIRNNDGQFAGVIAVAVDITARVEAEVALAQAHSQAEHVLENISDAFFALDRNWRFTYANHETEELLQNSRKQLLGQSIWNVLPDLVGTALYEQYQRAMQQQEPIEFQYYYPPFKLWTEMRIYPSRRGLAVYMLNITARKQAEESLGSIQHLLEALLEHAPMPIFIVDPAHRYQVVNREWELLRGLQRAHVIGRSMSEIAELNLAERWIADNEQVLATGAPLVAKEEEQTATGYHFYETIKFPIQNLAGDVAAIGGIVTDVTAYRQAAQEQMRLDQQKNDFLSLAAHELKTPLTTINGFTYLLVKHAEQNAWPENDLRALRTITQQVDRMNRLVGEMLDLARIDSGQLQINAAPLNLQALASMVVEQFATVTTNYAIQLEASQPVWVRADHYRLEQVLINLLNNAVKYSPLGSLIKVSVGIVDGRAWLGVRDHGVGVAADQLPFIFERFYRARNVGLTVSGLGLGLYLCRQIIEQHQGEIRAESKPGEGSYFHIMLPLADQVGESGT